MSAIAIPEPIAMRASLDPSRYASLGRAEGREGRLVIGKRIAVYQAWYNRSEYLASLPEDFNDELPAVYQSPIRYMVSTIFLDAGRHQPLPFPDSDD